MNENKQTSARSESCTTCGRQRALYDATQVAEHLRVHPETIRRMARTGVMTHVKVGRFIMFTASDVALYLKSQTVPRRPSKREIIDSLPPVPTRASMMAQRVAAMERLQLPARRRGEN